MDDKTRHMARTILAITLACIAGSIVITTAIVYLVTGTFEVGVGGVVIAVVAPAILAPTASYWLVSLSVRLRDANEKLRLLSETDPLTRTCNRRRFHEVAERQLALARRHGFATSVLLIDFDHFKQINDRLERMA